MKNLTLSLIIICCLALRAKGQGNVDESTTIKKEELTYIFYKVEHSSSLNAPFFRKNLGLPNSLIAIMEYQQVSTYRRGDILSFMYGLKTTKN